ncbi:hypothetical protein U5N28_13055 [Lysinibacillus telephonicus]|uniref:Lipoprotein n=1 Tax=Lysinibacillus telephonicus TaxID=1714840 RepID=A0A3S0QRJ7_9BACI|nr:hypothetical protein [Lysinibacillus telephonicus]RTQ89741.1 hypothetical protein EKG35_16070 [Lysinibacillus telephonicus]
MKKNIRFFITIFLSIMVLAACNTAEKPSSEPDNDSVTSNGDNDNINAEEQTNEEEQTDEEEQQEGSTTETNEESTSITFTSNDKEYTEDITPISGETYTLQAIPGFALTAEEPGKDILYYEKDDSVSMRIEAINESYSDLIANTEETMAVINEQYEPFDLAPYISEANNIENSAAYIANFENEEVIAVVFEKEDKIVRLTIYDNEEYDLSDAMIKMGLTIE